jgi:phasin family protein
VTQAAFGLVIPTHEPYTLSHAALQHFQTNASSWFDTSHIFLENNMLTLEQLTSAQKNNLNVFFGVSEKAFAGLEKMVELNLAAAKAAMDDSVHQAHNLFAIKDPVEAFQMPTNVFQPLAEKTTSYSRHVYEIATSTGSDITKAVEAQFHDAQSQFMNLVDSAAKNAPQGSESVVAMFKSALTAGQNASETVQKAIKQVTETAEANLQAMASTATATPKTTAKKRAA